MATDDFADRTGMRERCVGEHLSSLRVVSGYRASDGSEDVSHQADEELQEGRHLIHVRST